MKQTSFLRSITIAACLAAATSALFGQTNSIQLFGPTNVRLSQNGAGYGANEVTFNSSTVQLSCDASPIVATLASTPSVPGAVPGNVLVDNFVFLTVTAGDSSTGPVNVCTGGVDEPAGFQNCFTTGYESPASAGLSPGRIPTTSPARVGFRPSMSAAVSYRARCRQSSTSVDAGGYLASSSIYLNTNCTQTGVTGPADITGNPISSTNPTPQQLTQTFPFDSTTNQQIQFVYNLAQAQGVAGGLSITNNTIPNVADSPIDPTIFIPVWVPGTSFATSSCLTHTGELLPSGAAACKLYTLQCAVGTGSNQSGGQCPISQTPNEIFQEAL